MTHSNFFGFGMIRLPATGKFKQKVQDLGIDVRFIDLDQSGCLFYSSSAYLDVYEGAEAIGLSTGILREGTSILSSASMIMNRLITPIDVDTDRILGNGLVICLSKLEPRVCAYKTLFSAPQLYYWDHDESLICSNSLSYLSHFVNELRLDKSVLPMHFLFRSIPGHQTYLQGIHRLLPGEVLRCHNGDLEIDLQRTIMQLVEEESGAKLDPRESNHFFEEFCEVISICLEKTQENGSESAVLLSGGVDSTLLQLGVSLQLPSSQRLRSFSYVSDAPSFAPEIENARLASTLLGSEHTFIKVDSVDYPDLLITTIKTLGQPPHHEQMPYMIPLARQISTGWREVRYLFSGGGADTLHGMDISQDIHRAEKYRNWPLPILHFLGRTLEWFWQSKSYGASRAAELIPYLDDVNAYQHVLNTQSVYTDWDAMRQCFSPSDIGEALATRRELEKRYADSPTLVEKVHMLHLLTDMNDTAALWRQLSLAFDEEIIFPYMDEAVLRATLQYNPALRFFSRQRTKPTLKGILEENQLAKVLESQKYGGGFGVDLPIWMKNGVLYDLVRSMERPAFMEKDLFNQKMEKPDWFTWNMLTLDLFNKHILEQSQ